MYVGFEACVFSESMPKGGCGLIKESEWRTVWMCGWGGVEWEGLLGTLSDFKMIH